MCSTTRAALLTGRNHHSVGVGCLANFDSGFPGYRGKIAKEAGALAEMLKPHAYRTYMVGKWHVTPLTEAGATGPFDGWPLGCGFDRFYGFMDAATDQCAPELVRDNASIDAPGTYASGYHLTADFIDQAIRFLAGHAAEQPNAPWLLWLALAACHAPHQAPSTLSRATMRSSRTAGMLSASAASPARRPWVCAGGDTAAATERRRPILDEPQRR
jgi:arylsulfatase